MRRWLAVRARRWTRRWLRASEPDDGALDRLWDMLHEERKP